VIGCVLDHGVAMGDMGTENGGARQRWTRDNGVDLSAANAMADLEDVELRREERGRCFARELGACREVHG